MAVVLAIVVSAAVVFRTIRRHRRGEAGLVSDPLIPDVAALDVALPDVVITDTARRDAGGPGSGGVVHPAGPERPG